MKANEPTDQSKLTKEEAIEALKQLEKKLGRVPKKADLPDALRNRIRVLFGKWCYALAESGLVTPSEKVLEKRRKRAEHKAQVAERMKKREAEKKQRQRERRIQKMKEKEAEKQ